MASDLSLLNSFLHYSSEIPLCPTDSQHFLHSSFNFPSIFETISSAPTPSKVFTTSNPLLSPTSVSAIREGVEELHVLNTIGVTEEYRDYSRPNVLSVPDDGYIQSHQTNPDFFFQPHSSSLLGSSNSQTQMHNSSENMQFEEQYYSRSNTMQDDYCFQRLRRHGIYMDRAPAFRVEPYSAEERKERIHIYRSKRSKRNYRKVIKYECRKMQAQSRARIHGKFARETAEIAEAANDPHLEEVRENQLVDELQDDEDLHAALRGFVKCKAPQLGS